MNGGPRPHTEPAAALERVSKRFTTPQEVVTALDNVSFDAMPGEFACVYGASGSGKSTLINVLAGIDLPDSGAVTVMGERIESLSESARADLRLHHIGVVFQSNNLLPELTALDNITLPLLVRRMPSSDAQTAAQEALAAVGVADLADRLPGRMSGGQRQRVGIARALAGGQQVLLADEPTGALDAENSGRLFQLLRRLCDEQGTAVVLATHDPAAEEFADRSWHMVDGTIAPK